MRVELATSYHNATCGLCGNLNDDPADDLMLPSGKLASSANEFGVSQWLADVEGCSHECKQLMQSYLSSLLCFYFASLFLFRHAPFYKKAKERKRERARARDKGGQEVGERIAKYRPHVKMYDNNGTN